MKIGKYGLVVLFMMSFDSYHSLAQTKPLVPAESKVPETLVHERFKLKPLTRDYAELDYAAVMSSLEHLKGVFGPKSDWPQPTLTLQEDIDDLDWHAKEFKERKSFTYTVLSPDEKEVVGCVYIFPTTHKEYEAEIALWVSQSSFDKGLDPILFQAIKEWIKKDWPFKKAAYPGREISWDEWLVK